jgi:hypothetical protein
MQHLPSSVEAMGLIEEGVGFFVLNYFDWSGRPVAFSIKIDQRALSAKGKGAASNHSPFPQADYGSSTGTARTSVFFLKSTMFVVT